MAGKGSSKPIMSRGQDRATEVSYIDSSISLTNCQRVPSALNVGCKSLTSLVGVPDLELLVQINYMIDPEFAMQRVHHSIRNELPIIMYHGLRLKPFELLQMESNVRKAYPNVTLYSVPVPVIGTHHTKAIILFYKDNTMQLVVHTANLIEQDWRNKTQAVFTTGRLGLKPTNTSTGSPTCAFERDLLEYLERYQDHQRITERIAKYDFTSVRGVLIGSVPGKFTGIEKNKWGHMKLRSVLRQQVDISKECIQHGSQIICQISSIGSLGKNPRDWLRGEFETSLNAHRNSNATSSANADLCVIYPTAENVRTSFDGWSMGGSLPFRSTSYVKQAHYMDPVLYSWKAEKSGRERAMPHIKTFTRVSSKDGTDYLSWFLLTSANLSKPAWGELKDGTLMIKSYELGVLIFPCLFEDMDPVPVNTTPLQDDKAAPNPSGSTSSHDGTHVWMLNATVDNPRPVPPSTRSDDLTRRSSNSEGQHPERCSVVPVRLPYDLPLTPYNHSKDHVWLADTRFPGMDDFGMSL
ncbi:tyrosyl-DNA phosphodiesterase 1 [Lunasporangiospora selenospora]|uniref:Tyrosyl-DNA phosphodiesterase 1 n=1 Tax=Lunasporangiospora selenospora TaxID=979761 RepID=A0A9P6KEM1_9FUNG|nr:tyrosyl-DNA phosphodiesterase 1 [Lunasporangiospora selenospora]